MDEHQLLATAAILILGIGAQWLAWRLRLPSILLLLLVGFVAGPVSGFLDPDHLFGDLLFPVVSLAVAVILFEGGLSLKLRELSSMGRVLWNLLTIGALATWVLSTAAAYILAGLSFPLATLLGAILVVTGPTVIGPLLRHVRPTGQVGPILKWEGIVIDPIGAVLAVLVFEVIQASHIGQAASVVVWGVVMTVVVGGLLGLAGAGLLIVLIRRHWIPEYLQNSFALMLALAVFVASNSLQAEAGLLAVTVMGVALANQKFVSIRHIVEFKENLRVLLISSLFILLSARVRIADLAAIGLGSAVFLAALVLVVRPLSVALATWGTRLAWRERAFLAWMAPRGIVAAAVSSIFALRLIEEGFSEARLLVPLTFVVVIGSVAFYGLTATPVARWLKVSRGQPQGLLIAGAHTWARAIAAAVQAQGVPVVLVDTNHENIAEARAMGLRAHAASVVSEEVLDEIDLTGIGRLLALTSNDEVNSLAALHFAEVFGRAEVYQLIAQSHEKSRSESVPKHLRGRPLFVADATFDYLTAHFAAGANVRTFQLTKDFADFGTQYGARAVSLFAITEAGALTVGTITEPLVPRPGQTVVSIVDPDPGARRTDSAQPANALEDSHVQQHPTGL